MSLRDEEAPAVERLLELLSIPGRSGQERRAAEFIIDQLRARGVPQSAITFDDANRHSPIGGEIGNLIVRLPGTMRGPRRLLMAHLDTVPLCVGARPVRKGNRIVSADSTTALGGDNRAGSAVVLEAALAMLQGSRPHPPLTLLWTVQEEIGLVGARHLAVRRLGNPRLCFNWDGGAAHVAAVGATGAFSLDITVRGLASHAGGHPEHGVSAIVVAANAIADLNSRGWHGLVAKGRQAGTSNVGVVRGGEATNVVTDRVDLCAEARSHDPVFRKRIVEEFVAAFARAARGLTNAAGKSGTVEFDIQHKYESFRLSSHEPAVVEACRAIRESGREPDLRVSNGGLDANWLVNHGLPTVTLGCGQNHIHTTAEVLDLKEFHVARRIARRLASGSDAHGA